MPELPEVQSIVNQLIPRITGKRIRGISSGDSKFEDQIHGLDPEQNVIGKRILSVSRRGKAVIMELTGAYHLLIQLGMTGGLQVTGESRPGRYTRYRFHLSGGVNLVFRDMRKFGSIRGYAVDRPEFLRTLGPEPLAADFSAEYLFRLKKNRRVSVKDLLMNQRVVAGIGNIYASEILYAAGIRPSRKTRTLTRPECVKVIRSARSILRRAVQCGGTTIRDYRGADDRRGEFKRELRVYGREGQPCIRCGTPVRRIRQSNRSTFFCPRCQRAGRGR